MVSMILLQIDRFFFILLYDITSVQQNTPDVYDLMYHVLIT